MPHSQPDSPMWSTCSTLKSTRLSAAVLALSLGVCAALAPSLTQHTHLPAAHAEPSSSPSASLPVATPSPTVKQDPSPTPAPSSAAANTGQGDDLRQREYWLSEYGFSSLWAQSTGKGVTVAVIDTGVDGTHQDLKDNVLEGYDASGIGDSRGWKGLGSEPMHGTEVASLIAGHGHADSAYSSIPGQPGYPAGVIGVAPEAKILPISLNMGATGGKSIDEQIPAAVRYAVDHGAQIINLSVGSNKTSWPASWDEAFVYAEEKGVLVVAAAGNRGSGLTQVGAPATIPGVLTVGGVDRQRKDSWDSSSQGISIAVAAPSDNLVGAAPGNQYFIWSGSSAATPLVSGLAALIKSRYPQLSAAQIAQRIISSADDAGAAGRDPLYGYGIINPRAAMAASTASDATKNPLGSMKEWVAIHRKQALPSASPSDEAPVHEKGENIAKVAAPSPVRPAEDAGVIPPLLVGSLVVLVGIATAGTIGRLNRLYRHRHGKYPGYPRS